MKKSKNNGLKRKRKTLERRIQLYKRKIREKAYEKKVDMRK